MRKLALATALCVAFSGCYGPFNLTRKLHRWNGDVGGKWTNEAVFLGLAVLHVYTISALADVIVFNSIEFWSGKNPVNAKNVRSVEQGDAQAVMSYDPAARRLRVDSFERGRPYSTVVLAPEGDGMAARDGEGRLLARAVTLADGTVDVQKTVP